MKFFRIIADGFRKYAKFRGTAGRSDFWLWFLFVAIVLGIATIVEGLVIAPARGFLPFDHEAGRPLFWTLVALLALPTITSAVRRFHDSGKSGWWLPLTIAISVGWIFVMTWLLRALPQGLVASVGNYVSLELFYFAGLLPLAYFLAKRGKKPPHRYSETV
ncbi:MAG: DUF805 domain-containing protein [Rhizobiaceae bacterium]|jgi:uncharacterized membrane protein YhaH (DUF805 family)|nr:DUF805 domain-containing protein [Rhizobiaceae bacterium]